jgi:DNA (cytosine-5)-methyltransferase 1
VSAETTALPCRYDAVDLFAGPGGWDVAASRLGVKTIGIEWDDAAVQTRLAAGLPTIHGDVRHYSPGEFDTVGGLIASPPCQTFSAAGKGAGRKALDTVLEEASLVLHGDPIRYDQFDDERTGLVLEPLRWAVEGDYEWLAFEQVPTVLPVWEAYAEILRELGYSVVTGKLSAEQYGVPQTRKRAILLASKTANVQLPAPTHRPYKKGVPQDAGDQQLLPWVSMAEALGWTEPRIVVSNYGTGGDASKRGIRTSDEPAAVVTSKVDRNKVHLVAAGITGAGRPVPAGAPAPTITGKGTAYWLNDKTVYRGGNQGSPVKFAATNVRPNTALRGTDEPAPTLAFGHERPQWVHDRPATTVAGDSRIGQPGHKHMGDCHPDQPRTKQFDTGSVRVTVEEASLLQSFPPGYPWQGTKTKQYQQVGNAVPPGLAAAVLAQVATSRQDALEAAA